MNKSNLCLFLTGSDCLFFFFKINVKGNFDIITCSHYSVAYKSGYGYFGCFKEKGDLFHMMWYNITDLHIQVMQNQH